MTTAVGRRGSRSGSPPTRAAAVCEPSPSPPVAVVRPAPSRPHSGRDWIGPVAGLAAGFVLGHLLMGAPRPESIGLGVGAVVLQALGVAAAMCFLLRRRAQPGRRAPVVAVPPTQAPPAVPDTDLDQGVRDIRRSDRGFDAARFAGYAAMMFRDVQTAGVAGDVGALRDRVTPAMRVELEARRDRLRASGRSVRVAEVNVTAEVTEAWQDGDRDYVTAYVAGSMQSRTVDDATGQVVDGSPARPAPVAAFLTFTRPAGLNFWMLSLVQAG
jgi:predicted lipid-binding transport protein (Tim44 family)